MENPIVNWSISTSFETKDFFAFFMHFMTAFFIAGSFRANNALKKVPFRASNSGKKPVNGASNEKAGRKPSGFLVVIGNNGGISWRRCYQPICRGKYDGCLVFPHLLHMKECFYRSGKPMYHLH